MIKKQAVQVIHNEGMNIHRVFPTTSFSYIDPFLVMDHFSLKKPAGFPTHPHGGFEIITYMLEGALAHRDSTGQSGVIEAGGLQRITAGSGVEHSEFPVGEGENQGIQLWINLPREHKNMDPSYQEIRPETIPVQTAEGIQVKTLVGENSPLRLHQPIQYLDVSISTGKTFSHPIPEGFQGLVYVLDGEGTFNESVEANKHEVIAFNQESASESITVTTHHFIRFVFLAGEPVGEKPRFRGSFVD